MTGLSSHSCAIVVDRDKSWPNIAVNYNRYETKHIGNTIPCPNLLLL